MIAYILRRIAQIPIALIVIMAIVFGVVRASGDVVNLLLPMTATHAERESLRQSLGLNEPIPVQFGKFLLSALHGDFGISLFYNEGAMAVVWNRFPATLELAALSMLIATAGGIVLGILAAVKVGSLIDRAIGLLSVIGQSMPSFWLGVVLIVIFGVNLRWFPTSGYGGFEHLVLPTITLAAFLIPQTTLLMRSSMLGVVGEQYIVSARGKGLAMRGVIWRHAVPNALAPVIASVGQQFGVLVGGAVLTETIFGWPGVGRLSVDAIVNHDVPVVEACVVLLALGVLVSNLMVDVLNAVRDPRIRSAQL